MPVNTYHLRSSVKGKEPVAGNNAGQLPVGSIAINFNPDEPFLTIQDANGVVRRIAGVKIDSTAPTTPTAGEWWVDTSGATKIVKVFDGAAWVATGSPVSDATTAAKGLVQLANAAAVAAGTAGLVVTADQLKATNDAVATATAGGISTINGTLPVSVTGTGSTRTVAVADASTTAKGAVQLADGAAITAGTIGRVVDAAQLKAAVPAATTTVSGVVELATNAEAEAGTDATRAVTPAALKAAVTKLSGGAGGTAPTGPSVGQIWTDTSGTAPIVKVWDGLTWQAVGAAPADASETVKGIVELATAAETTTGTDSTRAVHPAGLKVELDKCLKKNIANLPALP
jgi:hypothetical protein